jgi:hypothetical protein
MLYVWRATAEWYRQGKYKNSEKNLSQCQLSTINPTWTDPCGNTGLRGERPVTNHLSHGTAHHWTSLLRHSSEAAPKKQGAGLIQLYHDSDLWTRQRTFGIHRRGDVLHPAFDRRNWVKPDISVTVSELAEDRSAYPLSCPTHALQLEVAVSRNKLRGRSARHLQKNAVLSTGRRATATPGKLLACC